MSIDVEGTLWRRNIAENFNRLSRVHKRYRQTTDGRTTTYSERERSRSLKSVTIYMLLFNFLAVLSLKTAKTY